MPTYTKGFKDIDLDFTANPVTGDVVTVKDSVSIKRGIKTVLLTEEGERLMQPELGSGIRNMLFEQMTDLNAQRLETEIVSAIEAWEARARIIAIVVTPEEEYNRYRVAVTFRIINELEEQELELFLQRER